MEEVGQKVTHSALGWWVQPKVTKSEGGKGGVDRLNDVISGKMFHMHGEKKETFYRAMSQNWASRVVAQNRQFVAVQGCSLTHF